MWQDEETKESLLNFNVNRDGGGETCRGAGIRTDCVCEKSLVSYFQQWEVPGVRETTVIYF